jgi:transcriptional regulator with XRE-family HTH domain
MPKRIAFQKKRARRRTFFKEWRLHRGLSQEQLAERLETSVASISRIESGTQPYTQDVLEALAEALNTDPASLIMRNPGDPDVMWSIWDQAKKGERQLIEELARSVVKTGTK